MNLTAPILFAAYFAAQSPAAVPDGPLTIDDAARIAERNAFAIRLQLSTIEANRQRVEQSRSGLGPQLSGAFTYNRLPQAQTATFGPGQPPVVIQKADQRVITGSLLFPIDLFGNIQRQVEASRANLRASRETLDATRNDVRLNARSAFVNVLRAQASVAVFEQALRDSNERLTQAKALLRGEQVAKVDVTRLEAQVEQSRADLVNAQNNLALAKYGLNLALARPIETPVEAREPGAEPEVATQADLLVRSAVGRRPEIRALNSTLEAASKSRRALEAGLNPQLSVGVNYQRNLDAIAFAQREQTTANLNISIPIFDSGLTRARVREARQNEEQVRINLEQTRLGISQEVRNALTTLVNARVRLGAAQAQVRAAEEVYRIAQVRQNAAEATYVEVVDALTQLIQARNGVVSAKYDVLLSYSQLQRAVGADDVATLATGLGTESSQLGAKR